MEEFKKIDLSKADNSKAVINKNKPSLIMKQDKKIIKLPKKSLRTLLIVTALLIGLIIAIVIPAQRVYSSGLKTFQQANKVYDAIKKQNIELAGAELAKTKEELTKTQNELQRLSFLKFIPLVSGYYNDVDHISRASSYGLKAGTLFIDSLKPYADVLGLKGKGSFVMGSSEQRIQTAIMTMSKVTPRIDEISDLLIQAQKEIDAVNPNHYPSLFGGDKLKKKILAVQELVDQGATFSKEARPLIKVLPSLLGETKEKKYLVLFQNDKELRPTGGFITAYAVFRIDKGIIHVDTSDDIYNLDNSITSKEKAPAPILKYLPKVSTFNLRDSNLSPDFMESMKTFNSLYEKAGKKTKVDGIIALDTSVLVATIKILNDEVVASGISFTTKEDKRCSCPQVIYVLEDNISRPVNYQKSGRKDLLGSLLYAIMEKSLKSSPKLYWGPLFQEMINQTSQKHILFYLFDQEAQNGVKALNAAGVIKPFEGDYLHINETNFAGAKSNMYVTEKVAQKIEINGEGKITKTLTIDYKNPYPPSDCNLERGGLCLNAPLRNWVRVYVPEGSELVSSQGSEVKVTAAKDLGKTVFEGFLTIRPQGAATYTLKYQLPFKLAKNSVLPLLIQKQPGTYANPYTIEINGKKQTPFELETDKELKLAY